MRLIKTVPFRPAAGWAEFWEGKPGYRIQLRHEDRIHSFWCDADKLCNDVLPNIGQIIIVTLN